MIRESSSLATTTTNSNMVLHTSATVCISSRRVPNRGTAIHCVAMGRREESPVAVEATDDDDGPWNAYM